MIYRLQNFHTVYNHLSYNISYFLLIVTRHVLETESKYLVDEINKRS